MFCGDLLGLFLLVCFSTTLDLEKFNTNFESLKPYDTRGFRDFLRYS